MNQASLVNHYEIYDFEFLCQWNHTVYVPIGAPNFGSAVKIIKFQILSIILK